MTMPARNGRIARCSILGLAAAATSVVAASPSPDGQVESDDGVAPVHGLGINPADAPLFAVTHAGLYAGKSGRPLSPLAEADR